MIPEEQEEDLDKQLKDQNDGNQINSDEEYAINPIIKFLIKDKAD